MDISTIYLVFMEAVPSRSNDEYQKIGGAYVNFWVKAETEDEALKTAKDYLTKEGWELTSIEEISVKQRDVYLELPDSLGCYDEACKYGASAFFYEWPLEED